MSTLNQSIEKHHKSIIVALALVIVVMVLSCTFHDAILICHWVFGCDHQMHVAAAF